MRNTVIQYAQQNHAAQHAQREVSVRQFFAMLVSALLLAFTASSAQAAQFTEGQDYIKLTQPEKIKSDKIIVREFFWYGCPHCYHLEPHAEAWKKTKPADVAFYQTPAAMNPVWEASARGFYSVQALGKLGDTHKSLFDATQEKGEHLYDQNSLASFYGKYGVNPAEFNNLYNSFAVTTKIGRSKAAAKRYQLTGVPAIVVHGKYVVKGSNAKAFKVVDYLVNKIRDEGIASK